MRSGASSSIPYKGILAIICIAMSWGPIHATIGYDCYTEILNMTTVYLENQDPETREALKSFMKLGSTHPDEFAYQYAGGPGYMARVYEDKIDIAQCISVEVKLEQQLKCYNRLAILKGNQRQFMTPWTHIITKTATELPCDSPLLQDADLGSIIYKVAQRSVETLPILKVKPKSEWVWKSKKKPNLATSGIYSEQEVDELQRRQNHPKEFNPPPVLDQRFHDANGNIPGVIYPHGDASNSPWYKSWSMYTAIALVSVCVFCILVPICIVKICNRQKRRRHHNLTIPLNKLQVV